MLRIEDLRFTYKQLEMHFDLTLREGGCLALVGPSGGGKTTLLNLIAGFETPVSGQVLYQGQDLCNLPPQDRPVTMLFQEHNLFPHLTAGDNVGLGIHPGLKLEGDARQRISDAMAAVGLEGLQDRLPRQLSGGQRQRVAIARSLVRNRPLLLLDEPFSALDPGRRSRMLDLIDRLRRENGLSVIMASHSPDDALRIADQCAFILNGRIHVMAPPADLLDGPEDPAIIDYLG